MTISETLVRPKNSGVTVEISDVGKTRGIDRAEEESRIVGNLLLRLKQCLGEANRQSFEDALERANIPLTDFNRSKRLTHRQLDVVIRHARAQAPDITLRLYAATDLFDFGLLGYAAASAGTVGNAFELLTRFHRLTTDRYTIQYEVKNETAIIRPIVFFEHLGEFRDIAEDCLAGVWRVVELLIGRAIENNLAKAIFDYPAPDYAASYHELIGCPCDFEAENTELRFPAGWLKLQIVTANRAMEDVCTAMCERIIGSSVLITSTTHKVQRLLISKPGRQMPRLEEAAEKLGLSLNQLRKRLYKEGTSFKKIVLDVRMTLARQYLEATDLPVEEIAFLLDYAEPAPFSRAFKSYFETTPLACRLAAI